MHRILAATLVATTMLGSLAAQTATAPATIPPPSAGLLLSYSTGPPSTSSGLPGPNCPTP